MHGKAYATFGWRRRLCGAVSGPQALRTARSCFCTAGHGLAGLTPSCAASTTTRKEGVEYFSALTRQGIKATILTNSLAATDVAAVLVIFTLMVALAIRAAAGLDEVQAA